MKFNPVMPYTWNQGDQVHQLDPLAMVPDSQQSESMIPLYQLIGMDQSVAMEISSAWRLSQIRLERNKLISETDWWVLPDRTPTLEQLSYRQALREITNNFDPTAEVVFPTKPE